MHFKHKKTGRVIELSDENTFNILEREGFEKMTSKEITAYKKSTGQEEPEIQEEPEQTPTEE